MLKKVINKIDKRILFTIMNLRTIICFRVNNVIVFKNPYGLRLILIRKPFLS